MPKRRNSKKPAATADLDPTALAKDKLLTRQRHLMARALRNRRRRKSGQ